jgi:hypothetical protein
MELYASIAGHFLKLLAFQQPRLGDALVSWAEKLLHRLGKARVRNFWLRLLYALMAYWYWKGAAQELGSLQALKDFLKAERADPNGDQEILKLDLRQGIEAAERMLDDLRPASVRVCYGNREIGLIPATPGAEFLRGIHLRPILATSLARPFLTALAAEGLLKDQAMARHLLQQENPFIPTTESHARKPARTQD